MDWIVVVLLVLALIYFVGRGSGMRKDRKKSENTGPRKSGTGKWVGAGIGFVFGGPIGALFGYMFGSAFSGGNPDQMNQKYGDLGFGTARGDFNTSLMVLIAALLKADGKVVKSELDFVKVFLRKNYDESTAKSQLLLLRDLLKQDIDVKSVAIQIGSNLSYEVRLQLLHFMFGIAIADGHCANEELVLIKQISSYFQLSQSDFESVYAMFIKDNSSNYRVLGIAEQATDDEVKSAYRKMAVKHHPDKVAHLGSDVQEAAKVKFQEINEAYESIKKERGIA